MYRITRWAMVVGSSGFLLGTGACLPDNFWAGKWGEIINRSIFAAINAAVGAATGGGIQL
jgi:hypothetical protein